MLDKIRSARSITELERYHKILAAKIDVIGINVSKSATEIDMSDLSDGGRRTPTRKLGKTATISGPIPDLPTLDSNKDVDIFKDVNDLYAQLRTLEQTLNSKIYDTVTSRGALREAVKTTASELKKLYGSIKKSFQESRSEVPTQFTQVLKELSDYLKNPKVLGDEADVNSPIIIPFTKNKVAYYQAFIEIEGLRNNDNYEYTQYQIVLTAKHSVADDKKSGMIEYFVTSLKSKRPPGKFTLGERIKKLPGLKQQVNALLSLDKVLSSIDHQPINATTRDLRKKAGIERIKGVDRVRVQKNIIYVTLIPGMPQARQKKTLQDVSAALRTVFRLNESNNNNSLVYTKIAGTRSSVYKFSLGFDAGKTKSAINLRKFNTLADSLGLDADQRQKIIENLK